LDKYSDFAALPATHVTHYKHGPHDMQHVSCTDKINQAESMRFSSRFKTSPTACIQPTGLRTTEYVTNRMKVIDDAPRFLSDQAINGIRATENVHLDIIDANLPESLEKAEKFAKICDLNGNLGAKVKEMEATGPVQEGPSRELAAAQQEIQELEEELQIKKRWSAKLDTWLDKFQSEPEKKKETVIAQLQLEKDMLLHQVKDLW